MLSTTEGIVLKTLKFKESSLIVTCFTRGFGKQTYLVRGVLKAKRSGLKAAHFQLLNLVQMEVNQNDKGHLNSIKELKISYHYQGIPQNFMKQSLLMFLSEFLNEAIRDEYPNEELFEYIENGLKYLDQAEQVVDFHLVFLMNLAKYIGCYPKGSQGSEAYFNLENGAFTSRVDLHSNLTAEQTILFRKLYELTFQELDKIHFSGNQREELLKILIKYYSLHLNGFREPKSMTILKTLFR